jgi:hypothetical protein
MTYVDGFVAAVRRPIAKLIKKTPKPLPLSSRNTSH